MLSADVALTRDARQYGSGRYPFYGERERLKGRSLICYNISTPSIRTSKVGLSSRTSTHRATSMFTIPLHATHGSCLMRRYERSLQALSHALLLSPQNPIYILQSAETAYTARDLPLSLRMFLVVTDMTDGDESECLVESTPVGITVRAWYGVKLVRSLVHAFVFTVE